MVLFFFYFPMKVAGVAFIVAGGNSRPPALNDSPDKIAIDAYFSGSLQVLTSDREVAISFHPSRETI